MCVWPAVATHMDPEMLIVDEVLAAGDAAFQKKRLGKINQAAGEGRTVLRVRHHTEAILGPCQRSPWMDAGKRQMDGPTSAVVRSYTSACTEWAAQDLREKPLEHHGDGRVMFTGLSLGDQLEEPVAYGVCGQPREVVLGYRADGQETKNASAWF